MNPSLYLIKYDGFDCVYGLELHRDPRVLDLMVGDRAGRRLQISSHQYYSHHTYFEKEACYKIRTFTLYT